MGCCRQGGTLLLEFALGHTTVWETLEKTPLATRVAEGKYVALIFKLLLQSWASMMSGDSCLE